MSPFVACQAVAHLMSWILQCLQKLLSCQVVGSNHANVQAVLHALKHDRDFPVACYGKSCLVWCRRSRRPLEYV